MQDGLADDLGGLAGVEHVAAGGEGGAGAGRQQGDVKGAVHVAVGRGGGLVAVGRGGRILAAGHAVDIVVEGHDGEAEVAARRMDEVVAADGGAVPVAGEDDDVELGVGKLDAGGEGDGAAVGGVDGVEVQIPGGAGGAADAGDDHEVVAVEIIFRIVDELLDGDGHIAHDGAVAAAGAPDLRQVVDAHILMDQITGHGSSPPFR